MADFSGWRGRRDGLPVVVAVVMLVGLVALGGTYATARLTPDEPVAEVEPARMPVGDPDAAVAADGATEGDTDGATGADDDQAGTDGNGGAQSASASADPLVLTGAEASCTADPSVDGSGTEVSYEPELAIDGDETTAWRCSGDGVGQTLTLELGQRSTVTRVGLVPGYAKTDPVDGTDRYAENRRISTVRWSFGDGTSVEQTYDTASGNRSLQWVRVPRATTRQIGVEILDSTDVPVTDSVAISSVSVEGSS